MVDKERLATINGLSPLIIHRNDLSSTKGPITEDLVIEVNPLSDKWLVEEATPEQIDKVLEARLQANEDLLDWDDDLRDLQGGFREDFGAEDKFLPSNVKRLLAYVELVDNCLVEEKSYEQKSSSLNSQYEEEKAELKERFRRKQGRRQKALAALRRDKYNPQLEDLGEKERIAREVEDIIFRKAVLEMFGPGSIDEIPRLIESTQSFLDKSTNEGFKDRKPIQSFFERMSDYLVRTKDSGLFSVYRYRESPDLIRNVDDCNVLAVALDFAFSETSLSGETTSILNRLGRSYLAFLRNRAVSFSQRKIGDTYSLLGYAYDLYTTYLYKFNPKKIEEQRDFFNQLFSQYESSSLMKEESMRCANDATKAMYDIYDLTGDYEGFADLGTQIGMYFEDGDIDVLSQPVKDFIASSANRIVLGFDVVRSLESEFDLKKEGFKTPSLFNLCLEDYKEKLSKFKANIRKRGRISEITYFIEYIKDGLPLLHSSTTLAKFGVSMDMGVLADAIFTSYRPEVKFGTVSRKLSLLNLGEEYESTTRTLFHAEGSLTEKSTALKKLSELFLSANSDERTRMLLSPYLSAFMQEFSLTPETVLRQNDFLWGEILDNLQWFISPRGDCFSSDFDPELVNYGIEKISFHVDPEKPREHLARVYLPEIKEPMEFRLDVSRNLLRDRRNLVLVDPILKNRFLNLILKRLFFITSGALSSEGEEGRKGEEGKGEIYKRAHYRILTSTHRRTITMQSKGAIDHAREIKEIYGIDIYSEIERRRRIGRLKPTQYLTFVKESVPTIQDLLVLPNQIGYDPSLIQLPNF